MDPATDRVQDSPERPANKRNMSSAILKSMLPSRSPKKAGLGVGGTEIFADGILPSDHPHAQQQQVLGEINNPNPNLHSPKKSRQDPLHVSLYDHCRPHDVVLPQGSPRKTSKAHFYPPKEKENTTPPRQERAEQYAPIWAQFTSQPLGNSSLAGENRNNPLRQNPIQLNPSQQDKWSPAKEEAFYTPGHSPVKSPGDAWKKSRQAAEARTAEAGAQNALKNWFSDVQRPASKGSAGTDQNKLKEGRSNVSPKKQSKVLDTVARINGSEDSGPKEGSLQGRDLDIAFEAVLVSCLSTSGTKR